MSFLAAIGWKVIDRIRVGPLAVSPHGLGIAVGYALGGVLTARRAERMFGVKRDHVWNMLMWAVVGVVIGARLFYVVGHLPDYFPSNMLGIFRVWEGGIVFYGGVFGGIAAAYPYARKHNLDYAQILDAAAPGFPLGLIFGRIGDLVIGDHLGGPTSFFLGFRYEGGCLPTDQTLPGGGCIESLPRGIVVHQTALYDLLNALVLLPVVLWLSSRRRRQNGWLIVFTATWYAVARFLSDFARTDTQTYLGLRGTQWVSIALMTFGAIWLSTIGRRPAPVDEPAPEEPDREAGDSSVASASAADGDALTDPSLAWAGTDHEDDEAVGLPGYSPPEAEPTGAEADGDSEEGPGRPL